MPRSETSAYLATPGRLSDVIAAVQVFGSAERPEREVDAWAKELSKDGGAESVARWSRVFTEHPEFFLVYSLPGQSNAKAALRWRYVRKLFDPNAAKSYTPEEKWKLPEEVRSRLTTKPLTSSATATLINTAIELHGRAMAERAARMWWVPVVAALPGFVGAVLGAVIVAIWRAPK